MNTLEPKTIDFGLQCLVECAPIMVVRVRTSFWRSGYSIKTTKEVRLLARKSNNDYMLEDAECGGVQEVIEAIQNLFDVVDGIYELKMVQVGYTPSSYYGDEDIDYEYVLSPITEGGAAS